METNFNKIAIQDFNSIFHLIGDEWMLITAGNKESFNCMTASWGTMGILWHKPITTIFIRPTRHTLSFINKNDYYTLCFFKPEHKDILTFCGTKSGKNTDKIKSTGLDVQSTELGNIYYNQAWLVVECKKIYADEIYPDKLIYNDMVDTIYPSRDFHKMFIGEIVNCWMK